ncbi:MAG: hypothetical protein ACI9Y1_003263, partial [Lentisphaeria bacterium]
MASSPVQTLKNSAVSCSMFIRKSPIKSKKSGGSYFSYRLVESVRVDGKVKQKTLLNLGKHFDVDST